jgi:hypothetical protein
LQAAQVQGKKSENTKENKVAAVFTLLDKPKRVMVYQNKNESNALSSIGG